MAISTESFLDILEAARKGELQLPEFQREYIWRRSQVIELFDSLRQRYPIGALLFMERNPEVGIEPRPLQGTEEQATGKVPDAFVLDGQQRITSGLALYYGLGGSQYYLDLDQLFNLANTHKVDLKDFRTVRAFLEDIDPDDAYCVGRLRRNDPLALLAKHLLFTGVLHDAESTREAIRKYVKLFPERSEFVDIVIRDEFRIGSDVYVPVTKVEKNRPVEAVSRIFATLNTTGQPLNSFELVVALLYPSNIRLRTEIREMRELAPHYANMDKSGEIFLQTIAMLAGKSPKKSQLPKTVRAEVYLQRRNEALEVLEELGKFLTLRLGVGLDQSPQLIPYDSIFPPMALALQYLEGMKLKGADRAKAENKLEKWFVAAALSKRYQEGVHNKQTKDLEECIAWLNGHSSEPSWIADFRIPRLTSDTPDGAVGKLLRCMINTRTPKDPISGNDVGERPSAVVSSKHHIFPTRWVNTYLQGWDAKRDSCDVALNVTTLSQETNVRWVNVDPANQISDIIEATASDAAMLSRLAPHFLDGECVAILQRSPKTKIDFVEFLAVREALFLKMFESQWGLRSSGAPEDPDADDGDD